MIIKKSFRFEKKVSTLQKDRNSLLELSKKDLKKKHFLKSLNPIIKNYMQEKKIRIVLDKKNILLADENLDITKEIMVLLNKQIKTLKLN